MTRIVEVSRTQKRVDDEVRRIIEEGQLDVRDARLDAITRRGIPHRSRLHRLAGITHPMLVANGNNDRLVPTKNSHLLAEQPPNARLKTYPVDFAGEVQRFLNNARSQ